MYRYIIEAITEEHTVQRNQRKFVIYSSDKLSLEAINKKIYMGEYDDTEILDEINVYSELDIDQFINVIEEQNGKTREIN